MGENSNSVLKRYERSYSGLNIGLNNQTFVIAFNKVPKTKNIPDLTDLK